MRGSREISLVPSLHRASTDALIAVSPFSLSFSLASPVLSGISMSGEQFIRESE